MAHPHHHAISSAQRFGGDASHYLEIHQWFDASKAHYASPAHRALRHHSEGIFAAEREFGSTVSNSAGKAVPVRLIGEQHVREDLGFIPTLADWLQHLNIQPWMTRGAQKLSRELQD